MPEPTEPTVFLTCPLDCPDACRLKITLSADQSTALKVTGDPQHPYTKGFACAKTVHYPARQYHPTRPVYPLKKVKGEFQRISWQQALDEIADRLREIIAQHGAESVLPYHYAGTMGIREGHHAHALFRALGACELDETICASAGTAAWQEVYGARLGVLPQDVPHAKLVLLWGINSLSTHSHLTPYLKEARKNGAKIIHIDPYQNKTSLFADQHIMLNAGTDAALALAMARYIFEQGKQDDGYLSQVSGWQDVKAACQPYTLAYTSSITGIPETVLAQLCHDYAHATPSYIRVGYGMTRHEYGSSNAQAILMLPALTGQWKYPGGGVTISTSGYFELNRRRLGAAHLIQNPKHINMTQLGDALQPENNIHALFVYNSNPVAIAPETHKVKAGFARPELLKVVLENAMTETAEMADYVLPSTTFLEHADLYTSYGHHYLSYNPATLSPLGEAKPNTWVFAQLAQRLGLSEPSIFWSMDELLADVLDTASPYLQGITPEALKQAGYLPLSIPENHLPYADGKNVRLKAVQYTPSRQQLNDSYPFRLLTPPAHHFLNSTYGMLDNLKHAEGGESLLFLNPLDAAELGLHSGDMAEISSEQGSIQRKVKIVAMQRKTAVIEGTWWQNSAGDGNGVNILTSQVLTDLGAGSTFHNTRVKIMPCATTTTRG